MFDSRCGPGPGAGRAGSVFTDGHQPAADAHYLAMALLNSVIPWLGLAYGELAVSSGLTSILNSTTPLWTALLAWWLTPAERLRPLSGLGVVLGFLGTAVLILPDLRIGGARATLVGSGCILLAALSYALAALYQRRRLRDASPFDAGFWQMALTALVMFPLAVPAVASARLGLASIMSVIALGVGASCAGIVLYYWLLNSLGAAGASTVNYLLPATAVVWGVLFLHETVTLLMLGGAVIILGGVLLTSLPRSRPA